MPKNIFITGTDTGAGKTLTTALLCSALRKRGVEFRVMKPVETGCATDEQGNLLPADGMFLKACSASAMDIKEITPFAFPCPVAPVVAAKKAGTRIDTRDFLLTLKSAASSTPLLIWEGAGGLLVPINQELTFADAALAIGSQCLLVVASRLGAINHALLNIEVIKQKGIPLIGYVLNDAFNNKNFTESSCGNLEIEALNSNRGLLGECAKRYGVKELGYLPYLAEANDFSSIRQYARSAEMEQLTNNFLNAVT